MINYMIQEMSDLLVDCNLKLYSVSLPMDLYSNLERELRFDESGKDVVLAIETSSGTVTVRPVLSQNASFHTAK